MSIYEAIGIGYPLRATTRVTVEVMYFSVQGLGYMHRLIRRGQAEENLDLQRSESVRRELSRQ